MWQYSFRILLLLCGCALAAAAAAPAPDAGERAIATFREYCLKYHDDFGALDRAVREAEPDAAPLAPDQFVGLIAESGRDSSGWVLRRGETLLWLTWTSGQSCAVSGKTQRGGALARRVGADIGQTLVPHAVPFAGMAITTMSFAGTSPYRGSMLLVFVARMTRRDVPFRIAFVPPSEVRRIVADYKRHPG